MHDQNKKLILKRKNFVPATVQHSPANRSALPEADVFKNADEHQPLKQKRKKSVHELKQEFSSITQNLKVKFTGLEDKTIPSRKMS